MAATNQVGLAYRAVGSAGDSFPGSQVEAPAGKWDLTGNLSVSFDMTKISEAVLLVVCRLDEMHRVSEEHVIAAGESAGVKTLVTRKRGIPEHIHFTMKERRYHENT
jgi:hypothetical protein